jgi:hypothetical protein
MRIGCAIAGLIVFAIAGPAAGRAALPRLVEVDVPDGTRIVVSGQGALSYPENGALVRAASARLEGTRLVIEDLSLLGGRVTAPRLVVPAHGFHHASVSGLALNGHEVAAKPNALIPLEGFGYVVALQEAVASDGRGLVGLRLHLDTDALGLRAGTDILVGLPPRGEERTHGIGPLALLSGLPVATPVSGGYVFPLAQRGAIIGCPFALGSTHSPFVPPDNLASDNAVDIAVPFGTPVRAVASGTIGPLIGPLDSTDPHLAGLRLHLDTPGVHFYYAHLSRIDVVPGEHVEAGQQLGLSGSAAGVSHLHFAQDVGDPAATVGVSSECPLYQFYPEPWG